jgi:hypothetical protein
MPKLPAGSYEALTSVGRRTGIPHVDSVGADNLHPIQTDAKAIRIADRLPILKLRDFRIRIASNWSAGVRDPRHWNS